MTSTTLVVPCFNESDRLPVAQFQRFLEHHEDISILFVDDGSTDETLAVLARLHALAGERVRILSLAQNQGKAEAVRCGVLEAIRHRSEYVAYWDADLATPLEACLQFRQVLQDQPHLQIVMGARVQLLGRDVRRRWSRQLLGRSFALVASRVLGLPLFDTQCGAKMFRVLPSTETLFRDPFRSRWIFDVELLARFLAHHRTDLSVNPQEAIYEIPLDRWQDVAGSKLKLRDFGKAVWELARIGYQYTGSTTKALPTGTHDGPAYPRIHQPASASPKSDASPANETRVA